MTFPTRELSLHYAQSNSGARRGDLHPACGLARLVGGRPADPEHRRSSWASSPSLGENRREALKIAAGFRGEEAFQAGVAEDQALDTVLPHLSRERAGGAQQTSAFGLYMWDRLGCDN